MFRLRLSLDDEKRWEDSPTSSVVAEEKYEARCSGCEPEDRNSFDCLVETPDLLALSMALVAPGSILGVIGPSSSSSRSAVILIMILGVVLDTGICICICIFLCVPNEDEEEGECT